MRFCYSVILLWIVQAQSLAFGEEKPQLPLLDLANLKVGDIGVMPPAYDAEKIRPSQQSKVDWVLSDKEFTLIANYYVVERELLRSSGNEYYGPPRLKNSGACFLLVKGQSTAGLITGNQVELQGAFKVSGIDKRLRAAKPVYILEPLAK